MPWQWREVMAMGEEMVEATIAAVEAMIVAVEATIGSGGNDCSSGGW